MKKLRQRFKKSKITSNLSKLCECLFCYYIKGMATYTLKITINTLLLCILIYQFELVKFYFALFKIPKRKSLFFLKFQKGSYLNYVN